MRGQLRVKRGVEHCDLRDPGQRRGRRVEPDERGRVVQRRVLGALGDDAAHLVVDHDGADEALAAVHDAVSDGLDLLEARDGSALAQQQREDLPDRSARVGRGARLLHARAVGPLVHEQRLR